MQGCHHQARRAKENSPVIDHWVRVSLCPKSRPGRKHPRQPGLIARLSPWVARATGPYRPATRRTERVRRSSCQRTPFVMGASSFFRHLTFVIRHSPTETIKNPRNNTFLQMKPHPTITQRNVANPWVVGRVTPCAPRLPPARAKFPRRRLPDPLPIKTWLEFPVPTSEFGLNPEPLRLKPETFNLKPS